MTRECAIDGITNHIKKEIIHIDTTSAYEHNGKPLQIMLPVGGINGENKSLSTKEQTYNWAKSIQKKSNKAFKSQFFGNTIDIDNVSSPIGTIVNIRIPTKLVDHYETKDAVPAEYVPGGAQSNNLKAYFDSDNSVKSTTILERIAKTEHPLAALAKHLIPFAKENNVTLFLDNVESYKLEGMKFEAAAYYNPNTNHIRVAGDQYSSEKMAVRIVIHEILHSITHSQLRNPESDAAKHMNALYLYTKANIPNKNHYPLHTIDEFIVGLFENSAFIKDLSQMAPMQGIKKFDNLFQEIMDYILGLLNINRGDTLYEQAYAVATNVIVEQAEKTKETKAFQETMKAFDMLGFKADEAKEDPVDEKVSGIIKPDEKQIVYFKRLLKKMKDELADLDRRIKFDPLNDYLQDDRIKKQAKYEKIKKNFYEFLATDNRQKLVNAAEELLDEVEQYISIAEAQLRNDNLDPRIIRDLAKYTTILDAFKDMEGVMDRVEALNKRLSPKDKPSLLTRFAMYKSSAALGIDVTPEMLEFDSKDIAGIERWTGNLSDVGNILGRTVGHIIGEKHAVITRENRESYNVLKEQIEKLEAFAKKKGMTMDQVFDLFVQERNGTLILTREYTSSFYAEVAKSRKMDKANAHAHMKKFGKFTGKKGNPWQPFDDIYKNPNYTKIRENPELLEFYNFYKDTIKEISRSIPINDAANFIPNIAEQTLMDIINSKDALGDKFKNVIDNITRIHEYEMNNKKIKDENLLVDDVPLKYLNPIDAERKSKRLDYVLLTFMHFASNYKHMSEILPEARLIQREIDKRKFVKYNRPDRTVLGHESKISQMVKDAIDMQIKGKMKQDESYAPYVDFGLRYTSLLRIGLNPINAMTNVFIGTIGNVVEGVGGRHYNLSEFIKGTKMFLSQAGDSKSVVNKLIDIFNPLQEMEDYENLQNLRVGSVEYKEKIKSLMYLPQRLGEKMMQTSTMLAHLMHTKVTTKDGRTISMLEAFNENGWNEQLMGYKLGNEEIDKVTKRIHRINQTIHGRYSSKVAMAASQYAAFRVAAQFKKWIPAAIESRFQDKRFDYTLGHEIEGRYLTFKRLVINPLFKGNVYQAIEGLVGPLLAQKKMIEKGTLTELEIYNMRKNLSEMIIMLAAFGMYMGLGTDDEKRKNNPWYKLFMGQLDRVTGDMIFWYNPDEMQKGLSGIPLSKTISGIAKAITYMPYVFGVENYWYLKEDTYIKGDRKGENKGLAAIADVTPGAAPIVKVARIFKDVPFQKLR